MKIGIKNCVEGRFIKKLLLICILVMSIIFITGCIGEEKPDTGTLSTSQNNQQSNSQTTELLLKQNDLLGYALKSYSFKAYPKVTEFYLNNQNFLTKYSGVLPEGKRNVGQSMEWQEMVDQGLTVTVDLTKYDSNSGFEDYLELTENIMHESLNKLDSEKKEEFIIGYGFEEGNPDIGDHSYYKSMAYAGPSTGIHATYLTFYYKNYLCQITVLDAKDKSKNEAIRIAKIIESRLD